MGHRHYFYEVENTKIDRLKELKSIDEFRQYAKEINCIDDDNYVSIHDMFRENIFEFGKLYFDDTVEKIQATGTKLFSCDELNEEYSDYDAYVVGKEAIKTAIDIYKKKIIDSIEEDLKEPLQEEKDKQIIMPEKALEALIRHTLPYKDTRSVGDKCKESLRYELHWIDSIGDKYEKGSKYQLSTSWLYKHSIFTLVAILRFFDFENKSIVFMGW